MKKIVVSLLLFFALAVTARAQLNIAGGFAIGSNSNGGVSVTINPELSYRFSPAIATGLSVAYRTGDKVWRVSPYFHWDVIRIAKGYFNIFAEISMPMHFYSSYFSIGARFSPGLSVCLGTPKVRFFTRIGTYGYTARNSDNTWTGKWSADLNWNTVDWGVVFSF